jgi:phenylacetate-coenzyme A ligase PaaK-like adenylate-forming protein
MLMERFDELVTDPGVRLAEVERYLETAGVTDRFRRRYRVAATGGTTGRRGIFLSDFAEWTQILASYSRAYAWAGLEVGVSHPLRMAIVSSRAATHQSSIVGATVRNPFIPTLRLDATDPMADTVAALNDFRPQALVGYASMLPLLADEQRAGRLRIAPRAVFSASEVLTAEIRSRASEAWGSEPFNVYAATETAGLASECRERHLHRYEDLVIAEPVDAQYRPVPIGVTGDRLLVTVLFSRTQPLIRYELSDRVRFSAEAASDRGPFGLLDVIEGREEDILSLPAREGRGSVRVHPNVFHAALEPTGGPWQVVREPHRLRILLADEGRTDAALLIVRLREALAAAGAAGIALSIEHVVAIPRTRLGKAPLVRLAPTATSPSASPSKNGPGRA